MSDIDTVLDNILEYRNDINSLVRQLKALGINSLEEFKQAAKESGAAVPASIQAAVEQKFANSDGDDWNEARALNTEESYLGYLNAHSDGAYRNEARSAIARLQEIAANGAADAEWENIDKKDIEAIIRFIQSNPDSRFKDDADDLVWRSTDKSDIDSLSNYVSFFPNGIYSNEANKLLRELRRERYLGVDIDALAKQMKDIQTDNRINNPEKAIYDRIVAYLNTGKIKLDDLMQALREDHNFISSTVANLLWENDIIPIEDFMKAGVTEDVLKMLLFRENWAVSTPSAPLTKVSNSPCTEVYFWGLPSSGKEMIIAAVLSEANEHYHMEKDIKCQGYDYMTRRSNLFKDGCVTALPFKMPFGSTEMGFNLCFNENKIPITFIEFSPWLIFQIRKKEALVPINNNDSSILQEFNDVMIDNRTQNRKLHFFVIEYGAEDRQYEGLPQQDYLQAAVQYIQRTGIFKKDTDGLYLLISKVDKAKAHGKELREKLKDYIRENYQGFYNGLMKISRDNEINGGGVEIIPFTLGETWFQDLVKYDNTASSRLLDLIVEHCHYNGIKPSMFYRIINKIRRHIL